MNRLSCFVALAALLVAMPTAALGLQGVPAFTQLEAFPAPAENAFGVLADALKDGRFVAYDGNSVLVQQAPHSDAFEPVASGYPGDPGFISVSPDGSRVLLGAGFNGEIWVVDLDHPVDSAAPIAVLEGNFSAVWLTNKRVVINRATQPDPDVFVFEAELGILDLELEPLTYDIVVRPAGGASSDMVVSPDRKHLYTADGLTGETRRFLTADLHEAAEDGFTLAWEDGDLLGTYNTGGPFGITPDGRRLLIGGADPLEFTGFVQVVEIASGAVVEELNPSGNPGAFSSGAVTGVTGRILIVSASFPGPVVTAYESVHGYGAVTRPLLWNLIFLHILQAIQTFLANLFAFVH